MKALTLTQPWATLVAFGEKTVETRSWGTAYRGPLAIHAAKGLADMRKRDLAKLCNSEPFFTALRPHLSGYTAEERADDLPRGAIVAIVELVEVVRTEEFVAMGLLGVQEAAFGNYQSGRFAWVLRHRLNLYDGISCRGALGLWDVPAELAAQLETKEVSR